MDRYTIIQKQVFNSVVTDDAGKCGEEHCECNDDLLYKKRQFRKTLALLAITASTAFVIAFGFANNTNAAYAKQFVKRYTAISCGAAIDRAERPFEKKLPANKNNENSCSHQQGSLCETNSTRRRSLIANHCNT